MAQLSLVAGLLVLGWKAATFGLAVTAVRQSPEEAARYAPNNALVLGRLAQLQLQNDSGAAAKSAQRALLRDPMNVTAAGALSIVFAQRGDAKRSAAMLAYATQLSRRDLSTELWAIEAAVQRGDVGEALHHYDIALRVGRTMPPVLFPVLASASADPEIRVALASMLAKGTPWKSSFLDYASAQTKDVPAAAGLVDAIYSAHGTVPHGPMSILIQRLIEAGDVDTAWRLYGYENPRARRAGVRNGDFSNAPELPTPFDWRLEDSGDVRAEILSWSGGGELHLEARAGASGMVASQRLALPAGGYALSFTSRPGEGASFGTSALDLVCIPSRHGLGQVRIDGAAKRRQTLRFVVPQDCSSQSLELTIKSGDMESGVDGAIDDVELVSAAQ